MDLLYQGVLTGEITLQRWVELCSTIQPTFGLQGRKGIIAPGADADIVIFNPKRNMFLELAPTICQLIIPFGKASKFKVNRKV